ncbi:MAG: MFS transporter [Verrucomicrobia bacterium CG_4_10_14_3_um_filter_43_23]|nr:MAG: MFS transporter [Verrucomicrobia bacterium CG22_combo_CG10-13_8_21_14_all_43_17]PIX58048.1 MAG: MFS transporter [Verrucomicrobia bacterium CG_4_10_14_3_um_filter_43_23]PIY62283.1 MAG: MFS transporter [Verrucomicrobia bacterium CG_4_10_14_0_8_um_filter_43_34]PJA43747.1 MAG: MFS transporter [Verrucomicrobia bacterium CG_4_9_14_3_um_filter_43_20]
MDRLLEIILGRSRTILSLLAFLLVVGLYAYMAMPTESNPDIPIPIIYVSMTHEGISPEDAERLLIRPMEKELRSIAGVKEMTATANQGQASVVLEFEAGFDKAKALQDVRERVDIAKPDLPSETDEPTVNEVNFSLFPVLVVSLSGDVPERTLLNLAKKLRDAIETIPEILEVDIAGEREEALEIIIDPASFEMYDLKFEELNPLFQSNNKLVAAGNLDVGAGRIPIKVPGLFETAEDIFNVPIKVVGDNVIRLRDIATLRKSYKDRTGFARSWGKPAIALEIKKRAGENAIQTIEKIREMVAQESQYWPEGIAIDFFQDQSKDIRNMLASLQNNLISAIVLVMVVVVAALGLRSSILVGISIPGSFLTGIFVLYLMGVTINIVVLFSLILAVGMLVDGAIVVTEYADRKMIEGVHRAKAYLLASQRMALPIIASTATTLAAFMPLLFWPGVVGEFMKYLPMTLICTLSASLLMALIFVPALGALIGKPGEGNEEVLRHLAAAEKGNLDELHAFTGLYIRTLKKLLKHPGRVFLVAVAILLATYAVSIIFGKGVEFFPKVEPDRAAFQMRVRGNLSIYEIDSLLKEVENRIIDMDEFSTLYSKSDQTLQGEDMPEDAHGVIYIEFKDWRVRRKADVILAEVQQRLNDVPGIIVELSTEEAGPPVGKPINIQLSSRYPELLEPAIAKIYDKLASMPELKDVEDSRPVPGFEWRIDVDRAEASRYGANIQLVGDMVQFVTNGLKIGAYRPLDSDDEVDILARYPVSFRSLDQIARMRVPTASGSVPLSNFITYKAAPKVNAIKRSDGKRVLNVRADVQHGVLADDTTQKLKTWITKQADLDPSIDVKFKGQDEEQRESSEFLNRAFIVALAVMAIILITQFNSFYDALLILTAVIFSTVGVFLGLLITGQPFGIVMNGIGVIALAGIVVNNNIVLIDTYIRIRHDEGLSAVEAVLRTCAQRLRPVMLTTITTILGLIPMVLGIDIDFIQRGIDIGSPSTQWWTQLSTSVAFGLAFATVLTLVLTPALLVLGDRTATYWKAKFQK